MSPTSQGKKKTRSVSKTSPSLPVLQPHAAGIDIGAREIYVAVPPDHAAKPVRAFATFTDDLHALRDWLQACGITSVAMESTGVYWIPLFQMLELAGIEVCLVNVRHCKNLPGRKSDVQDCQWLQYLHAVGLLRGSFRPPETVCAVRSLLRHRDGLVRAAATCVNRLHKALTQMNIQLQHVIADVTGVTGLAILEAILAGERNPEALAKLKDGRIRASTDTITKSLRGDWRAEQLFTLRQTLATWQHYQTQITDCDAEVARLFRGFATKVRRYGIIGGTHDDMLPLLQKFQSAHPGMALKFCYEAGPRERVRLLDGASTPGDFQLVKTSGATCDGSAP